MKKFMNNYKYLPKLTLMVVFCFSSKVMCHNGTYFYCTLSGSLGEGQYLYNLLFMYRTVFSMKYNFNIKKYNKICSRGKTSALIPYRKSDVNHLI